MVDSFYLVQVLVVFHIQTKFEILHLEDTSQTHSPQRDHDDVQCVQVQTSF